MVISPMAKEKHAHGFHLAFPPLFNTTNLYNPTKTFFSLFSLHLPNHLTTTGFQSCQKTPSVLSLYWLVLF